MVEGLNRQGLRLLHAVVGHAGVGDTAAHLHQAVEAAALVPWTRPTVRVESNIDHPVERGDPEPVERPRPVAVNHDVGMFDEAAEGFGAYNRTQVETGAPFAEGDLGFE